MTYYLGIDLGTTYTAAAVHDGTQRPPEMVGLGERGPTVPSVLWLRPDGGFVAGDAAERHAVTDPERIARQFKRRLGDPTPMLVGDASIPAEVLTGQLLRWVVDTTIRDRGGERPATIVLTHPANWGPYKRDLLTKAAELAGLPGVILVTEPQAAAIAYAAQERVDVGAVVAVYDLGGGTFDAAVLRKEADGGFTVLGSPEGIERLGGVDVDAALFAHVTGGLGSDYEMLDPDDPQALAAVARLRSDCTQAKEALSLDSETRVPVLLPTVQTEVRVTRAELEAMIRPTLAETVTALERAMRSASLTPDMVSHVLLVGGSSRIPLVAELVSSGLGRPVAVDAHPKHGVPLGAAIVAARAAGALRPAADPPLGAPPGAAAGPSAASPSRPAPPAPPAQPPAAPPPPSRPGGPGASPMPAYGSAGSPAGGSGEWAAASLYAPPGSASPGPGAPPPPSTPPLPSSPPPASPPPGPPPGPGWQPPAARPAPPGAPPGGSGEWTPPAPPGARAGGSGEWTPAPPPGAPTRGQRSGEFPPPPGSSTDLPPGFVTGEAKAKRRRRDSRKHLLMVVLGFALILGALAVGLMLTGSDETATLADVEVGDCFNGEPNDLSTVDCAEEHQAELFAVAPAPDPEAAFPGAEAVQTTGEAACQAAFPGYYGAGADVALANGLQAQAFAPTEEQWNDGETSTPCIVVSSGGEPLTGSVQGTGAAG